jgi:hypothetical protein
MECAFLFSHLDAPPLLFGFFSFTILSYKKWFDLFTQKKREKKKGVEIHFEENLRILIIIKDEEVIGQTRRKPYIYNYIQFEGGGGGREMFLKCFSLSGCLSEM